MTEQIRMNPCEGCGATNDTCWRDVEDTGSPCCEECWHTTSDCPPQPAADQPQRWEVYRGVDGWQVVHPDGTVWAAAITMDQAKALADHLNATGWQPPAPEPERPTPSEMLADEGISPAGFLDMLADHGYRVIDERGLGDAIEALRSWSPMCHPDSGHLRALLDALEGDRTPTREGR